MATIAKINGIPVANLSRIMGIPVASLSKCMGLDMPVAGNENLYAGGSFTTAGGNSANRIAKWDGSAWSALDSGLGNACRALAIG